MLSSSGNSVSISTSKMHESSVRSHELRRRLRQQQQPQQQLRQQQQYHDAFTTCDYYSRAYRYQTRPSSLSSSEASPNARRKPPSSRVPSAAECIVRFGLFPVLLLFLALYPQPSSPSSIVSFSAGMGRACVVDSLAQVRCWGQQSALNPATNGGAYLTLANFSQVRTAWRGWRKRGGAGIRSQNFVGFCC